MERRLPDGVFYSMEDTIFAPSTALGGAIAVIRISGQEADRIASVLDRPLPAEASRTRFARIMDGEEPLDDIMLTRFIAPKSYTGENMIEISCHGGYQTVQRILGLLSRLGFRPAEGGEFTKRAFLNGKMDLSQAEAVMDIITADAEQSRKAALNQLHGSVSTAIHKVEQLLLDALSGIDAAIDFPDEAEQDCVEMLPRQFGEAEKEIERLIRDGRLGRVLRDGLSVVIMGKPNVGKSSLMNAMIGTDRAIVTEIAGTTRDVLDERTSFNGVPVRLIDTAGIHDTEDLVETIGINRAIEQLERADVILTVFDSSRDLDEDDIRLIEKAEQARAFIIVSNKSDLKEISKRDDAVRVSAMTGEGIQELKKRILDMTSPGDADNVCITNERHLHALERALDALRHGKKEKELDCIATDIREALHELGSITGSDVDADVIDRIFERFCVGK